MILLAMIGGAFAGLVLLVVCASLGVLPPNLDPGWSDVVSSAFYLAGAMGGAVIGLCVRLRRAKKTEAAYELLHDFIREFWPEPQIQSAVTEGLRADARECDKASQDIIKLQQGGLKAVNEGRDIPLDDYERCNVVLQDRFRITQNRFYASYDLVQIVRKTILIFLGPLGPRSFKEHLTPPGSSDLAEQ